MYPNENLLSAGGGTQGCVPAEDWCDAHQAGSAKAQAKSYQGGGEDLLTLYYPQEGKSLQQQAYLPMYSAVELLFIVDSFPQARADARLVGIRAKRIKDAAENPDDVTKAKKWL